MMVDVIDAYLSYQAEIYKHMFLSQVIGIDKNIYIEYSCFIISILHTLSINRFTI